MSFLAVIYMLSFNYISFPNIIILCIYYFRSIVSTIFYISTRVINNDVACATWLPAMYDVEPFIYITNLNIVFFIVGLPSYRIFLVNDK